ncbi:MAG TPA: hypothetical protein VGR37_00835, partial [Longimicrobiaceae bacterium]|nr:hypothetical protein [Longimicrobiaceae bacterium]
MSVPSMTPERTLRLVRHPGADAFLDDARPELEQDEPLHGLILGVAAGLRSVPAAALPPYFATVRDRAGLALAAVMAPPYPLVLASGRRDAGDARVAL